MTKRKTRSHEANRTYRMSFPILKYLALKTEPVTAYELEKTKLDIIRNGKNEKARIDKPTIYESLKQLEEDKEVTVRDRKKCKDGRVRKKYLVTPRGVLALLGYGVRDGHVEISTRYIRDLAEKQKSSFPRIFDLWPTFVREKAEDLACRKLIGVCQLTVPSELERIEGRFFGLIMNDLRGGEDPFTGSVNEPDRKTWLEVVSRNDRIRKILVELTADGLASGVEENIATLRLLLNWKTEWEESQSFGRVREAILHMLDVATKQYPSEDADQPRAPRVPE